MNPADFLSRSATDCIAALADVTSIPDLEALVRAEEEGQKRKGVLQAIMKQIKGLEAERAENEAIAKAKAAHEAAIKGAPFVGLEIVTRSGKSIFQPEKKERLREALRILSQRINGGRAATNYPIVRSDRGYVMVTSVDYVIVHGADDVLPGSSPEL